MKTTEELQSLPQELLAKWIDNEGLDFEKRRGSLGIFNDPEPLSPSAVCHLQWGYEIRLAEDALNEYNLKEGMVCCNPNEVSAEKITEGFKFRGVTEEELDSRHKNECEVWDPGTRQFVGPATGNISGYTYRVPLMTPFPAQEKRWSEKQIEKARRIVNDIAEGIDNEESRRVLRKALAIYADLLNEALKKRSTEEMQKLLEVVESLQERNTRDVAGLIERLQVKTEREGFVNLAILPEGLRVQVEQAAEVWRMEAQARRLAWQREVLGLG